MKRYLILYAIALILAACVNDSTIKEINFEDDITPAIKLSSSLSMMNTRSAVPTQTTQIANGEIVYAWIEDHTTNESVATAWTLTANGNGELNSSTPKYYPSTGNNIDVYCIHGNFSQSITENTTDYPSVNETFTHTVEQDQTTNYAKSDLLYGSLQDEGRKTSGQTHQVDFKHKLTKIVVQLKQDDETNPTINNNSLANAQVYVLNTMPTATFTFTAKAGAFTTTESDDGYQTAFNSYGGTVTAGGSAYSVGEDETTKFDLGGIKMLQQTNTTPGTDEFPVFAEAIIVPQTFEKTKNFLRIDLASGGKLYAKLAESSVPADGVFLAGKEYTYTVTVGLTGISLTSSISDWGNGGNDDLDAKMKPAM